MTKRKSLKENIQELLDKKLIKILKDDKGEYYCSIEKDGGGHVTYPFYESEFKKNLKNLYYSRFNKILSARNIQSAANIIETIGYDKVEEVEVCKRIFNNDFEYVYELNREEGTAVWIENGVASIEKVEGIIFRHAANYANQVNPNLKIRPTKLLGT